MAAVKSVTFSPESVPGGQNTVGTVTLAAPAPRGGVLVLSIAAYRL